MTTFALVGGMVRGQGSVTSTRTREPLRCREVDRVRTTHKALWIATLLAGVFGFYLSIRVLMAVEAAGPNRLPLLDDARFYRPESSRAGRAVELDVGKLARAFDLPVPAVSRPSGAEMASSNKWSRKPARSSLHGYLVGTMVATPVRYSLCQMTNADTNETLVYGIGDQFMGTRIYAIDKTRVFIDNGGRNEYIDFDSIGVTRSATSYYQLPSRAVLQDVEPVTPQG